MVLVCYMLCDVCGLIQLSLVTKVMTTLLTL